MLFILQPAFATTVAPPSFASLVQRADLIFTGRALRQRAEWRQIDGQRSIVTIVTFDVLQVHKGRAGKTQDLQFVGGTIGAVTLDVDAMPKFQPGEHVVLFVEQNGVNLSPLVGLYHGKFSLRRTAGGDDIVLKHNGEELTDVEDLGRQKSIAAPQHGARAPMKHHEFTARVAEAMKRNAR